MGIFILLIVWSMFLVVGFMMLGCVYMVRSSLGSVLVFLFGVRIVKWLVDLEKRMWLLCGWLSLVGMDVRLRWMLVLLVIVIFVVVILSFFLERLW